MIRTYEDADVRYTYRDNLVEFMRSSGGMTVGRLELMMPENLGFCWGVDRALAMVRDATKKYKNHPLWLLSSLIHNPRVNQDLLNSGIRFLRGPHAKEGAFEGLNEKDVVIVPAFSAQVKDMEYLEERGVTIVDTTCPWVIKPHKRAQKYIREGFTTVIHGTVGHDETLSTCSLVEHGGGHYVVVHNLLETMSLAAFLKGDLNAEELLGWLHPEAISKGFVASEHLQKIGIINQTTMLATESRAIGDLLRQALVERGGEEALADCFRDFDTICGATQTNQDAAIQVVENEPDIYVVVGGYDSSNTKNLARVGDDRNVPAYHIEDPACLHEIITHRDRASGEIVETSDWFPKTGAVKVAFSAGASTPDTILGEVVRRVADLAGETLPEIAKESVS